MTLENSVVELASVSRHYGDVRAVHEVSFNVRPGEFFAMLGPSGSGKTTCLRLIAGFEQATAGKVMLDGRDVSGVPPYERDVNTVFQDYALFPHMSVIENVAYGLRMKGVAATARREQAQRALEQVELGAFGERSPAQLSGGQRQRVALARAIVNRPKVLLLDEPLGALDLRLREQMQGELKKLHRQLGISFVYVTHDQGEAMAMADRVAVFEGGRLEQVDSPRDLYQRPASAFVAEFVGGSNVLRGTLAVRVTDGAEQRVSVRPELVELKPDGSALPEGHVGLHGTLTDVRYLGAYSLYEVEVDGQTIKASVPTRDAAQAGLPMPGQRVHLTWHVSAMLVLKA